jgi:hypothetical protein
MTTDINTSTVTIGRDQLTHVVELLEITDTYLRRVFPRPTYQLDELLRERGITGGPGWLIDTIGLTAMQLHAITSRHTDQHAEEVTGDE